MRAVPWRRSWLCAQTIIGAGALQGKVELITRDRHAIIAPLAGVRYVGTRGSKDLASVVPPRARAAESPRNSANNERIAWTILGSCHDDHVDSCGNDRGFFWERFREENRSLTSP